VKEKMEERKKAAALKYERGKMNAPQVVAKGEGIVAEKIVELARKHGVPIVEDKLLVSMLVKLDPGEEIPPELYRLVAKVLACVYSSIRRR